MTADPGREAKLDAWLDLALDQPGTDGPIHLPMLTGSMVPDIPVGAWIEIEKIPGPDCRVGDVVVFRRDEKLIAHRLLWRLGWGASLFLEKGDANSHGGWIKASQIRGRVVAVQIDESWIPWPGNPRLARAGLLSLARHILLAGPRKIRNMLRNDPP